MISVAKNNIRIEIEGMDKFLKKLERKAGDEFKREVSLWLEGSGMQFLEEVQRMIKSMQVVDTRRLLNSFDKAGQGNVWEKSFDGLSLTIGTNVEYARYVNDGHWTDDPSRGRASRFIPGTWSGGKFTYIPGARTGMVLKLQYIQGRPYFDNAVKVFGAIFARSFEQKLKNWANRF